jgi:hypothetical protein
VEVPGRNDGWLHDVRQDPTGANGVWYFRGADVREVAPRAPHEGDIRIA